ncbi:MAG: hypothetical protein ABIK09_19875 [Pseudomonadota bacterium]
MSPRTWMTRTTLALIAVLTWLAAGCLESNPQPSPGSGDAQEGNGQDTGAWAGLDTLPGEDAVPSADGGPGADTAVSDTKLDVCTPDCAGKECGDDGCGGECCGGEPMEPGALSCCDGGISGRTCSEYCPGWLSAPPECIPSMECLQPCIEECPEGWTCTISDLYGTDLAFYCIPEPLGPPCQPCETDADCPGGILWVVNRCAAVLGEVPTCVSECSAIPKQPCLPWYSCVSAETVDGEVLDVCIPDQDMCECLPPAPYLHNGTCVECLTSAHCGLGEICNQVTWGCETPNICDPECCYCQAPYESCIQSWGVWMCIECPDDLACGPGGTCDPVTFTCSGTFPEDPWCPDCITDEDCWDVVTALDLACDPASGCCFDRLGRCNNFSAKCIGEVGSGCVGLHAVSTGPTPTDPTQTAACTCSTPWSGDPSACWPDGCPDDGCLGATVCASAELASAAGLLLAYEGGLCLDIHLFVSEPEPDFGSSE